MLEQKSFARHAQQEPAQLGAAIAAAVLMALMSLLVSVIQPTKFLADERPKETLENIIPSEFADWKAEPGAASIVNPQARELIDKLYVETISRTYVDARGRRVMLAVAYGRDQRDSLAVHRPDICYPAQGFALKSRSNGKISTQWGDIKVRRIDTSLGDHRREPVTYWTTLGDKVVENSLSKKSQEIQYFLKGKIADGLLFRVSTIEKNIDDAFVTQDDFINDLASHLSPEARRRIYGLSR